MSLGPLEPFTFTEDELTESRAILDQDLASLADDHDFHGWVEQIVKCVDTLHKFAHLDLNLVPEGPEREGVVRFLRHHVEGTTMLMAKFAHEVEYEGLMP